MSYTDFLATKEFTTKDAGFTVKRSSLHATLFDYQKDIVLWGLRKGRCCFFTDTGTGKTRMQVEWARHVQRKTKGKILILAPLAVAEQTIGEAKEIDTTVTLAAEQKDCAKPGIYITNYEKLHRFDADEFIAVVLDESSIIKHQDAATRKQVIEAFEETRYKLACTATPAPNDHMELGNHAEFVGVLTMAEMLATYFVHDGGETQKWRLKGHAEDAFWKWLAGWAICCRKPSDLGYSDKGFTLPKLHVHKHIVATEEAKPTEGYLLPMPAASMRERIGARRDSIEERVAKVKEIVGDSAEAWAFWCKLNDESQQTAKAISGTEVTGSQSPEEKASNMLSFAGGKRIKRLVSKASICGFGMNFQVCHNVVFVGMDDSYEGYYQAVRRFWRYGQKKPVHVHLVISAQEGAVLRNIERKEKAAQEMMHRMVKAVAALNREEIKGTNKQTELYMTDSFQTNSFTLRQGDCIEGVKSMADNSVHYSIFSPPFASLYTYSASERDMGNCADDGEFAKHFGFLVPELFRILKPGRLVSFHCMNLPTSKSRDGYIGIRDFRGDLIRAFIDAGFIYHSEVVIWKDPLVAMQRTKAVGLLHKQLCKDSAMSRQGIPDYLVTMRKPGDNPEPVAHGAGFEEYIGEDQPPAEEKTTKAASNKFSHVVWQRYASPVWMDINPSKTLQKQSAREERDERHICPLQLEVIERALALWTNPGDIVYSPFTGIGSEGYCAIKTGRKFVGDELKRSYYEQALANLKAIENERATDMFPDLIPAE